MEGKIILIGFGISDLRIIGTLPFRITRPVLSLLRFLNISQVTGMLKRDHNINRCDETHENQVEVTAADRRMQVIVQ